MRALEHSREPPSLTVLYPTNPILREESTSEGLTSLIIKPNASSPLQCLADAQAAATSHLAGKDWI